MTNSERIEAYFSNQLSEIESQQLLHDIDSDATMKAEFQFQQDVVTGIKAYRKQELITKLDNVQIASVGQTVLIKSLSVVGIATVLTVGGYMWYTNASNVPSLPENQTEVFSPDSGSDKVSTLTTEDTQDTPKIEDDNALETDTKTRYTKPKVNEQEKDSEPGVPVIVIPDVTEPDSGVTASTSDEIAAPEAMSSSAVTLNTSTDVEVKMSKKYKFHYQVKDGSLILYGDFNDSPFEVLEMKTNKGIRSYLFYKDKFYCLEQDSEEIKPLILIENSELISELQKRR